jgi:hypothetical protein
VIMIMVVLVMVVGVCSGDGGCDDVINMKRE